MQKSLFLLSCLASCLQAVGNSELTENAFSLRGDFAYFKREQGSQHKLIIDSAISDCSCHYKSCTTKELLHHVPFEPGFSVGVSYTTGHSVWDLSYLWIRDWKEDCSRSSATNSLIFSVQNPGITSDFYGASEGRAKFSCLFQNCVLNYVRYPEMRYSNYFSSAYVLGIRYMNLDENLTVSMTKGSNTSSYVVRARNHIPALQVGGLIAWIPTRTISWDLIGMVGVGLDSGYQKNIFRR